MYNTKAVYKYKKKDLKGVNYKTFREVVEDINTEITNKVIDGYKIKFPLGTLSIIKQKRNGILTPNWNETKKLKAKLLEQGETLYQEFKDENGNVINNGGKKYIVYFTDKIYYVWSLFDKQYKKTLTGTWKFKPTYHNARAFAKRIKEDELNELLYENHKQ